jgi:hypothetical protein
MGTESFRKKNLLDIKFSIIALFVLMVLYWLSSPIIDGIYASNGHSTSGDNSFFTSMVLFLGPALVISLFFNILIQTFLNNTSVKNKTKSYVFFAALNIDVLFFGSIVLAEGITALLFFFIIFIFIRYLIVRYYYKELVKKQINKKS